MLIGVISTYKSGREKLPTSTQETPSLQVHEKRSSTALANLLTHLARAELEQVSFNELRPVKLLRNDGLSYPLRPRQWLVTKRRFN